MTWWLAAFLAWSHDASATDYYLEGPAFEARVEAVRMSRAAGGEGLRSRVVRRYRIGPGWQYALRVDGLRDEEHARRVATELAARLGHPIAVFRVDEGSLHQHVAAETLSGSALEDDAPATPAEAPVDQADPGVILERSAAAHGGTAGVAALRSAHTVLLRFRRSLPDGLVMDHTWARRGEDLYVDVAVVEGTGTSSTTLVTARQAWLTTRGGVQEVSRANAIAIAERLAPERVVPFVLAFADAPSERDDLASVRLVGEPGDRDAIVLRSEGDRHRGPVEVELDPTTALVRRIAFENGRLEHRFADYRERAGGLRVPRTVETWRAGRRTDHVEIRQLDLDLDLPARWFAIPVSSPGHR